MSQSSTGIFSAQQDIGSPALSGSSSFSVGSELYTLRGAGYNIWFDRDEFQYVYQEIEGDFILTGDFRFVGKEADARRKVGWMVRESTDEQAAHLSATLHGDGLTAMQWRELRGAFMRDHQDEIFPPKHHYNTLQLERKGQTFVMRAAHKGEPLQVIGSHDMPDFPAKVLVGLFICAHNPAVIEEAQAWNVRIDQPVANDYDPYDEGFLGCRLELMNVFDGHRKVIYEHPGRFEAPNWMPGGDKLLFNMNGHLHTIPVAGGEPTLLPTGFADRNNNDHGISFDGKKIAISHHVTGLPEGGSTIYVLPIEGGEPRQVTTLTPSYWHGWNPNNQEVVFVGKRPETGSSYHIFKADIETGAETQLSFFEGYHVDGPEYAPDGEYIYYNGNQSGTMQIWRMKPDGTAHEQLTFDQYNDWFPHISPDGKWLVFLSFPEDIDVDSHPAYQRVMLRLMPVSGGAPRVIAHLYGGQGTINVPSWSPNSKQIAFVSNY
ncbi:MAG: hypothetical protein NWR72_08345 [Bacteroidia bacterium]|nr:hypothetical protein [Bacteroidia bacterium]